MIDIKELKAGDFVKHTPSGRVYEVAQGVISVQKPQGKWSFFTVRMEFNHLHHISDTEYNEFEIVKEKEIK